LQITRHLVYVAKTCTHVYGVNSYL